MGSGPQRGGCERGDAVGIKRYRAADSDSIKAELDRTAGHLLSVDRRDDDDGVTGGVARQRVGDRRRNCERRLVDHHREHTGVVRDRVVVRCGPGDRDRGRADRAVGSGCELRLGGEHALGLAVDKATVEGRERRLGAAHDLRLVNGRDRQGCLDDGERAGHERDRIIGVGGIRHRHLERTGVQLGSRENEALGDREARGRVAVDKAGEGRRQRRPDVAVGDREIVGPNLEGHRGDRERARGRRDLVVGGLETARRDGILASIASGSSRREDRLRRDGRERLTVDEALRCEGEGGDRRAVGHRHVVDHDHERSLGHGERARLVDEVIKGVGGRRGRDCVAAGMKGSRRDRDHWQPAKRALGVALQEAAD